MGVASSNGEQESITGVQGWRAQGAFAQERKGQTETNRGQSCLGISLACLRGQVVAQLSRLERAIGVIYRPDTERASHYLWTRLRDQFDAVLIFDETRAVEPIERTAEWDAGEVPETFPFAV